MDTFTYTSNVSWIAFPLVTACTLIQWTITATPRFQWIQIVTFTKCDNAKTSGARNSKPYSVLKLRFPRLSWLRSQPERNWEKISSRKLRFALARPGNKDACDFNFLSEDDTWLALRNFRWWRSENVQNLEEVIEETWLQKSVTNESKGEDPVLSSYYWKNNGSVVGEIEIYSDTDSPDDFAEWLHGILSLLEAI